MSYQQTKHQLWIDRVSIPADNGMANWVWHRCYVQGFRQPNYPVPAIKTPTFNSLYEWGYCCGLNKFPVETVLTYYKILS